MIDIQYPEIDNHTKFHREFRMRFVDLKRNLNGVSMVQMQTKLQKLLDFYVQHIQEQDMQIKEYYIKTI